MAGGSELEQGRPGLPSEEVSDLIQRNHNYFDALERASEDLWRTANLNVNNLATGLTWLGYAPVPLGADKRPLVKWGEFHVDRPTWRVLFNDWWPIWVKYAD